MKTRITFIGLLALGGFTLLGFRNWETEPTYLATSKNPLKKHPYSTPFEPASCTQCHDCQPPTPDSLSVDDSVSIEKNLVLRASEQTSFPVEPKDQQGAEPLKSN